MQEIEVEIVGFHGYPNKPIQFSFKSLDSEFASFENLSGWRSSRVAQGSYFGSSGYEECSSYAGPSQRYKSSKGYFIV